ncbi:TetR/AcrR family transcriptional regulator [Aestuariibius sp. 2305UL40-4]|uniref:TetR/AcrR family transcriptional regulator n=1 Tax=Aestuariibius violaceus TaxID=3234132 RepID=UPI00345E8AC6
MRVARGDAIETAILDAATEELARHGPEGFSVVRVAAAAEVNKTSIYRRWPDKDALMAAAIARTLTSTKERIIDTGSLVGDLSALAQIIGGRLGRPQGKAPALVSLSEAAADLVSDVASHPMAEADKVASDVIQRARQRDEWDTEAHPLDTVLMMLAGAVFHRILIRRRPVSRGWAHSIATIIGRGVSP